MKSLYDISDKISEEEYRSDGAYHYSTISRFDRTGYEGLKTLFDRVETPSLLLGSGVDEWITGSEDAFYDRFMIANVPTIKPVMFQISNILFNKFGEERVLFSDLSDNELIDAALEVNYQPSWSNEAKLRHIKSEGVKEYYELLALAKFKNKTIMGQDMFIDVTNCVNVLKTSPATGWYFKDDNDNPNLERLYQIKFSGEYDGLRYSCMMDEVIVDHLNKIIYPIDLKTSNHKGYDFYKSFIEWGYSHQARLYARLLKERASKDEYFKDFRIEPYRFIVVNAKELKPKVWLFEDTFKYGTLNYKDIMIKDPFDIAKELDYYLNHPDAEPIGISEYGDNSITQWLNK